MHKYLLSFLFLFTATTSFSQQIKITNPQCDYKVDPVGVDAANPKFSWIIKTAQRNFVQSAYHILVSDNISSLNKNVGDIWDSKKMNLSNSIQVRFDGKKLFPAKTYYWKVQVWNNGISTWSSPAKFTTALFNEGDWNGAKWIGYEELPDSMILNPGMYISADKNKTKAVKRAIAPYFRKEFGVNKQIVSAFAFISGLGEYKMSINGKKLSEDFLTPGWTDYNKTCLYNTYDVKDYLVHGKNVVGVLVGNGFHYINRERYTKLIVAYGYPKMICFIKITFNDGSQQTIFSGDDWKTSASPITYNSIYGGEDYDARLEQTGWDKAGFNDGAWKSALLVKPPLGKLFADNNYPIKVYDSFTPKNITHPNYKVYLYDFGQNAAAIIELKVKGKKGDSIKLTPTELVEKDQSVNQRNSGVPYYFTYILKGDGEETWRPQFSYYGLRYVQVIGAVPNSNTSSSLPKIISLRSLPISNSSPVNGTFTCSNTLFNKIFTLINWAIKSNLQSVVTDCPHREKLSWLEQDYLMGNSIHYNYDIYRLYRKLVHDMMDEQTPDGLVTATSPEYDIFGGGFRDTPEWGSSSIILPWLLYTWYGDREIVRTAYPMMQKYVTYLKTKLKQNILNHGLGDWYDLGPKEPGPAQLTPRSVTATAIYYYDIVLLGKMATLLGENADADNYKNMAAEVKKDFNAKFFNAQTKVYSTGSQTSMAMPLVVGLVDETDRDEVLKNLEDSINKKNKALTAGDIGFHFLIKALDDGNLSQLIFDMNNRNDVPGYGYQLKKGATSLTESWAANDNASNNHLMLGHIMEWFYSGLAGISAADDAVAYDHIVIRPHPVGDITFAKATFNSPYGLLVSDWKKEGNKFLLRVEIPANTVADILFPANTSSVITEGNIPVSQNKNIIFSGNQNGVSTFKVGSGNYNFVVKN